MEYDSESLVLSTLTTTSFLILNRELLKKTDCDATAIITLSELISQYQFLKERKMVEKGDWFFCTVRYLEERIGLSDSRQRKAIRNLENYGFIFTVNRGIPRKRYFKINFNTLATTLSYSSIPSKKEKRITVQDYYKNLNEEVQKTYADFISSTDKMSKELRLGIYYWTHTSKKYGFLNWSWDSQTVGILRTWVLIASNKKLIDYSVIMNFWKQLQKKEGVIGTEVEILKKFYKYQRNQGEKAHSERIETLQQVLKSLKEGE